MARERLEQRPAVLAQRTRLEYLLDDRFAVLEHAQIERHRSGVDRRYAELMIVR